MERARVKARKWRELIEEGKDPRDEEEKKKREELRKKADTFDGVVEAYAKKEQFRIATREPLRAMRSDFYPRA